MRKVTKFDYEDKDFVKDINAFLVQEGDNILGNGLYFLQNHLVVFYSDDSDEDRFRHDLKLKLKDDIIKTRIDLSQQAWEMVKFVRRAANGGKPDDVVNIKNIISENEAKLSWLQEELAKLTGETE